MLAWLFTQPKQLDCSWWIVMRTYTILSLDIVQCVDVKNICVEELMVPLVFRLAHLTGKLTWHVCIGVPSVGG